MTFVLDSALAKFKISLGKIRKTVISQVFVIESIYTMGSLYNKYGITTDFTTYGNRMHMEHSDFL